MQTSIKRYEVEIEGDAVVWNVMKRELEEERKGIKKDQLVEWEEENWRRKAEFNSKGEVIIPTRWLHSTLINACMKTRIVPHFATTKTNTYTNYVGAFRIENNGSPVCKEKDLEPFGCYEPAQGKKGGGKVWRVRPMKRGWKTKFIVTDPEGRMLKKELQTLLDYAGLYIGIGDARVRQFGRFEVKSIKEVK